MTYNRTNIIHNMTTPVPQRLKYILYNVGRLEHSHNNAVCEG
jgi:hypothetical protein